MITHNVCGPCTMCCKLLGVKELDKPALQWCPHCTKGVGCSIYPDRPSSCRTFQCVWLRENLPEDLRPDKSRVVLDVTTDGSGMVAHLDPAYPDAHMKGLMRQFLQIATKSGLLIFTVLEQMRTVIYSGPNVSQEQLTLIEGIKSGRIIGVAAEDKEV